MILETALHRPRTILRANARTGTVGHLVIAAGTPYEVAVRDARSFIQWSEQTVGISIERPHHVVYHHTAGGVAAKRSARYELNLLIEMARSSEWGLPYNFVVMPAPPFRIWYLNDIDTPRPHTYGHNGACAVAAYGNFETDRPDERVPHRMTALADALATMWDEWVQESQHRDWYATACPGRYLAELLPSLAHQRDFPLP